jgi:hypothetical protein
MKSVNRKIRDLEDSVLQPIEKGSTKISVEDLPEAEVEFFKACEKISKEIECGREDLTPQEFDLLREANKRIIHRTLDLFDNAMQIWFQLNNGTKKFLWTAHFYYFLFEFARHMNQVDAEEAIEAKTRGWKQYEKEWKKYKATLSDEDNIPLWTPESFSHFLNKYIFVSYEEYCDRTNEKRGN